MDDAAKEKILDRLEQAVDAMKVVSGIALVALGILVVWHQVFAFTGFSPDPIGCTTDGRNVSCPSATYTTRNGNAQLQYGTRSDGTHPAAAGYTYGGVCASSSGCGTITYSGSSPIPATSGFLPASPSGCASVTSIRIAWVDNSTIQASNPIDTPGGICSGAPQTLHLFIDAINFPAERGGLRYSGDITSSGSSTLAAGEYVTDAYVLIMNAAGLGIRYNLTTDELTSATGTFSSSDETNALIWPAGTYTASIHESTTSRSESATDTVTIIPHVSTPSAATDGGGGGSWGDGGVPTTTPGTPTYRSFTECLHLELSSFSCLLNAALFNIKQFPPFNVIAGIPVNMAYVMDAPTSTVEVYIQAPTLVGVNGGGEKLWLYDSTSSTQGIMGAAPIEWWTIIWTDEKRAYYILTLASLVLMAIYLKTHL